MDPHNDHMTGSGDHTGGGNMHDHMHDSMHGSMNMQMMMTPKWFSLRTVGHVLFENVTVETVPGIVVGMVTTCLLTVLYDVLMYSQMIRTKRSRGKLVHFLESVSKLFTVAIGYLMMLLVMTFNVWLLVSAVLGAGFSYFLCRPFLVTCCQQAQPEVNDEDAATKLELLHDFTESKTDLADGNGVPV